MGWLERLFPYGSRADIDIDTGISSYDPAQRVLPDPYEPFIGSLTVADPGVPLADALGRAQVEHYWATQPQLRKVVGFIARTTGSIPLHLYDRKGDTDRRRVHDGPLAAALRRPGRGRSPFRLWEAVVADGCLYDRWVVQVDFNEDGDGQLTRLPAWRTKFVTDDLGTVEKILYWTGDKLDIDKAGRRQKDQWRELDMELLAYDHGYAPRTAGLTPVHTLRAMLDEQDEASAYRRELLQGGPRVPAWVSRPADAPKWKDVTHRKRFIEGLRDYSRGAKHAGGWPLLEDGMEIHDRQVLSPQDVADVAGRELTAVEVCTAYHISPEILGARQGTFGNVDAFRQMLYGGAALGPYVDALEGALNALLVPALEKRKVDSYYIEANIEAKMRGSFEEQASVKQSATGAPWLTRNEARALENRPPIEGGDELVVPLNVLVGGLAAPNDTAPDKPPAAAPATPQADPTVAPADEQAEADPAKAALMRRVKAQAAQLAKARRDNAEEQYRRVLGKFFRDQQQAVKSAMGAKAGASWWDADRWNDQLVDLLLRLHLATSERAAKEALEAVGADPGVYEPARTVAYLKAVAQRSGKAINETTLEQLLAAQDAEDPAAALEKVWEATEGHRLEALVVGAVTLALGFGVHEAARQGGAATKTWITGPNARPAHAKMNGQTVPVSENFSNGMAWPGDPEGGVDDLAGCNCELQFNY